jgi:hypothetical protein
MEDFMAYPNDVQRPGSEIMTIGFLMHPELWHWQGNSHGAELVPAARVDFGILSGRQR